MAPQTRQVAVAQTQRLVDAVEASRAPVLADQGGGIGGDADHHHEHDGLDARADAEAGDDACAQWCQQSRHHGRRQRFDDVAGHGGQADVQDVPRGRAEAGQRSADHAFPEAEPVNADEERCRPCDHERPGRPLHAERRQTQPAEDQERPDEDLQDGSRSDHEARIDRVADGPHQAGADHGQPEQRVAERRDPDVGDDQVEHDVAGAQHVKQGSCEGDQENRAGDVERQYHEQTVGGEERRPLAVAGTDGACEHGPDSDTDATGCGANGHQHGKGECDRRDGFRAHPPEVDRLHETRQRHGEEAENHEPRKAHEMAGQIALGERGVGRRRTSVQRVHEVIGRFRNRCRSCRSVGRPEPRDACREGHGRYRMSGLRDRAPFVWQSSVRIRQRLALA